MTYIVAKSYENLTQIGNPFDRNGKKYIKVKERCSRCGGTGHYPSLEWNGICLKCGGAGYITKDVRVYTESERLNLDKAAERTRVKAAEKRLAKAAEVRQKSYRFHGFDNEGNGFIVCSRHTYELKDDIKAHDGRWNGDFNIWVVPNAFAPNSDNDIIFVPCKFFDLYDINNNWTCYRDEAKDRVKSILAENMESLPDDSEGEWVGKIGERLRNLPATVEGIDFNNKLGCFIYKIVDEKGNTFNWFTGSDEKATEGQKVFFSGTVKAHKEFRGQKTTTVNRCMFKER